MKHVLAIGCVFAMAVVAYSHPFSFSLPNSLAQFDGKRTGHVAFLGGSITEMEGYRPILMEFLSKRFPKTKFTFTNAGISSTCSTAGAFRLKADVLDKGPLDLLFVEYAVNDDQDAGHGKRECIRGMEGIVRQVRLHNPRADIVNVHFVNPGMLKLIQEKKTPTSIEGHGRVASHYGVAQVNVAAALAAGIADNSMTWEKYGGVHPARAGNEFAAREVIGLLEAAWKAGAEPRDYPRPQPLDEHSYFRGRFVEAKDITLGEGFRRETPDWKTIPGSCRDRFRPLELVCAATAGSEMTVGFTGKAVGAYLLAGPDAGIVEVSIDGGPMRTIDTLHRFSKGLHYPRVVMFATDLTDGPHTLKLRVAERPPGGKSAVRVVQFVAN